MATITTDTFLDAAARTAGEAWTLNGATLTVRTDTRVHAGAPASMTGTIGSITASSSIGGGLFIDGTQVRWVPFNTGSGNVPAIGTTLSQSSGAVSGYLLGVWVDNVSAPVAPGAAMPTSGFIKLREVTGGAFSAGAITGIGASATGPDVVGWIEVVFDNTAAWSFYRPGLGFKIRGAWYELGTTDGTPGQTFQIPANGGGANTVAMGVQIETSPGSGVFEWYPAVGAAAFSTGNLTTDLRAKFVQNVSGGQFRIGSNGTSNIGFTPASGCKVRMPNVIGRSATTAARATNAVITTKTGFGGGGSSDATIDFEIAQLAWNISTNNAYYTRLKSVVVESAFNSTFGKTPFSIDDFCVGVVTTVSSVTSVTFDGSNGGSLTNSNIARVDGSNTNVGCIRATAASDLVFDNVYCNLLSRTISNAQVLYLLNSKNCQLSNIYAAGCGVFITGCSDVELNDLDYIDRLNGNTSTGQAANVVTITLCQNVIVDGITFGRRGALTYCNNYGDMVNTANNIGQVRVRNGGTKAAPLNCGANAPSAIWRVSADNDVKVQRIYVTATRIAVISSANTQASNSIGENLHADSTPSFNISLIVSGLFARAQGAYGSTSSISSQPSSTYSQHFYDVFTSATAGFIRLQPNEPGPLSASYTTKNFTDSRTSFSGSGKLTMYAVGEFFEVEMPYFIKGITSFQNSIALNDDGGAGTIARQYQIDTGSGWNGTWKTISAANLSAETVSPTGMKLKFRWIITAAGAYTVAGIILYTNSTAVAQENALYDLDTVTLSFEGLQPGSEVRAYVGTDPSTSVEIGGTESVAGTTFSFSHSSSGLDGYIAVFALGYNPIIIPRTYAFEDSTLLISQVVDRNYVNP